METKIIKQKKNPFLEREEITLEIKNKTTPTADEIKSTIGKDASLTVVKKINTNFGSQTFFAEILIYDNIEARNKIETIPKKIRKKIKADEKTATEAKKKANAEAKAKTEEATKKAEEAAKKAEEEAKATETASEETKPEEIKE